MSSASAPGQWQSSAKAPNGGDASPDARREMSSHQKLVAPHFAAQFPIQMKHAFEKDVILRRPRRGLYSPIARFPGAEAPGWPYVAPVGGFIHQAHLCEMSRVEP